ncbi:hypothetical protein DF286_07545 [Sphingosinicella humi]|uniref:Uncharacterized protein n=1 Tax=Allosphingosinicella humi TaxID=2068657 RepID=A0A2U2J341_9SPHN|nr:hypothetical protein DF286_07545 [Sphingosinicella humi]
MRALLAVLSRHCEERSDEAIQARVRCPTGLLRYARNDGISPAPAPPCTSPAVPRLPGGRGSPSS